MAHLSQPQLSSRLSRPLGLALTAAAGLSPLRFAPAAAGLLLLCGVATTHADDELDWAGGTAPGSSWTASNAWYDSTTKSLTAGGNGISYSYVFPGPSPFYPSFTNAPTSMGFDESGLATTFISFLNGFNATNTTTVGRLTNNTLANPASLNSGWQIANRGVGGTVTFAPYATGNVVGESGGLYFTISGAGSLNTVAGSNLVMAAPLGGSGSVAVDRTGSDSGVGGTVTLAIYNGNVGNTYSGGTTVSNATLVISNTFSNMSATGSGALTVNSGGTLAGNGPAISNTTVNSGGVLSPGTAVAPVGRLQLGSGGLGGVGLTLNGTYGVDIVGGGTTAGVNNDQVVVTGNTVLSLTTSRLTINAVNPAGLKVNDTFYILLTSGTGLLTGNFNGQTQGSTVTDSAGDTYTINYLANGDNGTLGNDISLTVTNVVPEPSPALLALVGLAGVVGLRRWRSGTPRLLAS